MWSHWCLSLKCCCTLFFLLFKFTIPIRIVIAQRCILPWNWFPKKVLPYVFGLQPQSLVLLFQRLICVFQLCTCPFMLLVHHDEPICTTYWIVNPRYPLRICSKIRILSGVQSFPSRRSRRCIEILLQLQPTVMSFFPLYASRSQTLYILISLVTSEISPPTCLSATYKTISAENVFFPPFFPI